MVGEMPAVAKRRGVSNLLSKEQDIAQGVTKGLTSREIARDLGLTEHTVKNYASGFSKNSGFPIGSNWSCTRWHWYRHKRTNR
jgi:FixJ family two-component response regulator